MIHQELKNEYRWRSLMHSLKLPPSIDCYESLVEAYKEKHRHYHTVTHINAMLGHFNDVKHLAEEPLEVELAIWFHDAIYNPLSNSNEKDSAEWAKNFLVSSGGEAGSADRVYQMIMATKHDGDITDNDHKLIVDIDLTILGSDKAVYDGFEANIRKEYKLIPSFIFRRKRKEILKSFIAEKNIYKLDYFAEKFETQARENISRAISKL